MEVFRITKEKYANTLFAPGVPGRWNKKGEEVIYTASSRSLACLENLIHKSGRGGTVTYKTMVIYIPDTLEIQQVNFKDLPVHWNQVSLCRECQHIGSNWYASRDYPVLKVPSAVIPDEYNYVLNSMHPDFKKILLIETLPFSFDKRFERNKEK